MLARVPSADRQTRTLDDVFRRVLEARRSEYDPWFYRYCGHLSDAAEAETYLRYTTDLLRLAGVDPRGARVLDAGSGFGFTLVKLAYLGAREACGLEIYEPMVATTRAYLDLLPPEIAERIQLVLGSVSEMPYEDASFDLVLSIEAISHYRDVDGFLREAARVLRPGGVLVIADGNNGLNPLVQRKTHELWDAFERGGAGELVHGHVVEHCYEDERREFVEREFPDVPASRMARETFGMTYDEVAAACRRFLDDGSFPGSTYDGTVVPVNPNDGTVVERLFDPYALSRRLDEAGFDATPLGYWGGASGRKVLRLANAILRSASRVTIYSARGFTIVARRR
jgi:SAM-dependent methyltransferase